jgi:hypothetical protein
MMAGNIGLKLCLTAVPLVELSGSMFQVRRHAPLRQVAQTDLR